MDISMLPWLYSYMLWGFSCCSLTDWLTGLIWCKPVEWLSLYDVSLTQADWVHIVKVHGGLTSTSSYLLHVCIQQLPLAHLSLTKPSLCGVGSPVVGIDIHPGIWCAQIIENNKLTMCLWMQNQICFIKSLLQNISTRLWAWMYTHPPIRGGHITHLFIHNPRNLTLSHTGKSKWFLTMLFS